MPDFQYVAREISGQEVTGVLSVGSEAEVISSLSTKHLFPVRIELAEEAKTQQKYKGRRVRTRYLVTFYSQLADLLRSGVPLLRSLEILERQTTSTALKVVLQEVRDDVADGTPLAEAMRHHSRVFSDLAVSMIRAGEEGAFLEDVLKRVAGFTEHQEDLKSRVLGAMAYPAFLLVVGTGIVAAMLIWFVPKFAPIFARMEARGALPLPTTVLMTTSGFLGQYWLFALFSVVAGLIALVRYAKTERGAYTVDRWRLSVTGAGPIVRSLAISRFCRILGTLLKNGVPILQSIRISKDAAGNRVLSEAIALAADNISAGKSLAGPLAESHEFPEEVVEMIAVGEEANNLEQVLVNIAENMERRTYRQLELFVRLLEPIMLLIMGGLILFVAAGLLLPVLQSSGAL